MTELIDPFSAPQERPAVHRADQVPFHAYVDLLRFFLLHRDAIVERIDRLLNCQKKPIGYQQDLSLLSHQFQDCFFALPGIDRDQSRLRDQLEQAHWTRGFRPRQTPGNGLVDPAEMMVRGFHLWRQTRWPGHKGRVRYAHTLFNLYLIRCLALLNMRLWDEESDGVGDRLSLVQDVLDRLWSGSPADQPTLVRDVRWLIPVAMSPTTDELAGYFDVAERIAETFTEGDRTEIQKAWVLTGAGHLRSQLRHLSMQKGVSLDENGLVLITRKSNALDVALLVQGLVTLFAAYERAWHSGDEQTRLALADAIFQGVSPDPELFLNRLDLLGPYSMIEHLFITTDSEGQAVYTAMGRRHLRLLQEYEARISRLSTRLHDDCRQSRPVDGAYSPYGALYGFSSNLIELMAFKTLQRDAVAPYGLEDVFTDGDADKRVWVSNWRNLPHIKPDVVKQFEYPQQFAEDISARIGQALQKRTSAAEADTAAPCGRLFILPEAAVQADSTLSRIPDLPLQYIVSSDPKIVAAHQAEFQDQDDLLHCRLEGEFVVSYRTPGGWVAITKDLLTEVSGAGRDVKIAAVPRAAAEVLSLMCPNLVVLPA